MFEWLFGKKKPKTGARRAFNHLDALGVDKIKPFIPPPPPSYTFSEAIDLAKDAIDRAEQGFPPKRMVQEGPRTYWVEFDISPEAKSLEHDLIKSLDESGKQRVRDSVMENPQAPKSEDSRPTWPETWMNVAKAISQRSYDPRLQVGAIVVSEDNTRMLSVGYNGNYRGGPNEPESLEPGKSGMIHAEQNALVKCDFNFPKKKHMYLTHSPCRACAKLIVNAEISRVVYNEVYRDPSGIELLKTAGVEVYSIEEAILKAKS